MKKTAAIVGLLVAGIAFVGCTSTEPEISSTPTPSEAPQETETPAAEAPDTDAHQFGDTVRLEFDGSVWDVTVNAPADAPARISEAFPLDEGTRYVAVQGTITRVEGGPVRPISELDVQAIVNGVFVTDEYLSDDEFVSLNAAPELLAGGTATFAQMFVVEDGQEVKTVIASLGMGEAAPVAVFGEAVDFGGGE